MVNKGEWLDEPFHQLPWCLWVNHIWCHRLVSFQVPQHIINYLLIYINSLQGVYFLSTLAYQLRGLVTLRKTGLTVKEAKKQLSITASSSSYIASIENIKSHNHNVFCLCLCFLIFLSPSLKGNLPGHTDGLGGYPLSGRSNLSVLLFQHGDSRE